MRTIQVIYDLRAPGRNYAPVWDYLKTFEHIHPLESTWLIRTSKSPQTVCEDLLAKVDSNDHVACFDVSGDAWWARLDVGSLSWMQQNMSPRLTHA